MNGDPVRANKLFTEGKKLAKKVHKPSFFSFSRMFGNEEYAIEEDAKKAVDMLTQADIEYKLLKDWAKSAECLVLMAESFITSNQLFEACERYKLAGEMYRKLIETNLSYAKDSISCYECAYQCAIKESKFSKAGKMASEIGKIYDVSLADYDNACIHYQKAIDWLETENNSTNDISELIACIYVKTQKYFEGGLAFHNIAKKILDAGKIQSLASRFIYKECLCLIASGNALTAKEAIDEYAVRPFFTSSFECKFLSQLVQYVLEKDIDGFEELMHDLDSTGRLDDLSCNILVKIKSLLKTDVIEL